MMDIAEIRKKAKSRVKTDDPTVAFAEDQAQEEMHDSLQGQVEAESPFASPDQTDGLEEKVTSVQKIPDGLDRLFAASEEFVLATDESYADVLENQAESQNKSRSQYLAFHLGTEEYALDIRRISEIIKVREFTDIPRAPEFVLGIISLRGVVVPVFDLRCRLSLGVSEILPATRIVVSQLDDVTVGLLVDSINQVINLSKDEIEPPPGVLAGLDREMVSGIGRYQGRMIILLNLSSALNVELIQD